MLKIFLIALLSSIGFTENYYDATWLTTSDVKYFLANSTKRLAKKRLFGGRFASAYTDIVISMCSNVAVKLFVDAQRKKSRIQILSRSQTRSLVYGTTYNVIVQTHDCENQSVWNEALYKNFTSFMEPDDYEFTGTIDKYGKLTDDWFVYMDLTAPRITKNYKHLFGASKTTSLIQGNILSMASLSGIVMTTCHSLAVFEENELIISSAAKWQVPRIQMVQVDWVDCNNGENIKSQCFEAKYHQSYKNERNSTKVIQILIDLNDGLESLHECPISHDHADLDLDLDRRRRRRVLLQTTEEPDIEGTETTDLEDFEEMAEPEADMDLGSTEEPEADLEATEDESMEMSSSGSSEEDDEDGDGEGMDIVGDLIDYDSNPFDCASDDFCFWTEDFSQICGCGEEGEGDLCFDTMSETPPDAEALDAAGLFILDICNLDCDIEEVVFLGDLQSDEFVVRAPRSQEGYLGAICSCNLYECEDAAGLPPGAGVGKISLYPVIMIILSGIFFITL